MIYKPGYDPGNGQQLVKDVTRQYALGNGRLVNLSSKTGTTNQGAVKVLNLGKRAGVHALAAIKIGDTATPGDNQKLSTRVEYPLQEIGSTDVSGKTFSWHDLVDDTGGTITFNADNTGTVTNSGTTESFNWNIGPDTTTNTEAGTAGGNEAYNTLHITWSSDSSTDVLYRTAGSTNFIVASFNDGGFPTETTASVLTLQ